MRKKLFTVFLTFLLIFIVCLIKHFTTIPTREIFKNTITVEEFLYDKNPNRYNELYLNKNGNVEYKNMIIISNNNHKPLRDNDNIPKEEMKILYKSGWYRTNGVRLKDFGLQ